MKKLLVKLFVSLLVVVPLATAVSPAVSGAQTLNTKIKIPPILYCAALCKVQAATAPDKILDPATTGIPMCYVDGATPRILVCYDPNHPKAKPRNHVARAGYIWKRQGKWWIQVPDPRFIWKPRPVGGFPFPVPLRIGVDVPLGMF